MKIEGDRTGIDQAMAAKLESIRRNADAGTSKAPASGEDSVRVSAEARLATDAVAAAQQSPDVRPAEIARAKALLDAGQLGADPERLADKIIDRLLDEI